MDEALMLLFLIAMGWLVCVPVGGWLGGLHGRSGAGCVLGFLFGPLGCLIAVCLPDRRWLRDPEPCPACGRDMTRRRHFVSGRIYLWCAKCKQRVEPMTTR